MPFTLAMPKLSPTMEAGTITKWHVKLGDKVKEGDLLFEVATDKATVEYNALDEGYLRKILVDDGKEAFVNQPVAIFTEKSDENIEGYAPEGPEKKIEGTSAEKTKEESVGAIVLPQSSTQTTKEMKLLQPSFVPEPPLENYRLPQNNETIGAHVRASPLAKKLAKEKGIDLTTVKGTGPNQRIIASDIERGQPNTIVAFGRRETPLVPSGSYEEISMTPIRKLIGQRLQEAKTFIPHFYVSQDIRCEALHEIREQLRNLGLKISFNDMILRATALALRHHPEINSGYDSEKQAIIRFKSVDISVAVSIEGGLITPIVRYADFKNLGELSTEMKELAEKAKSGKLQRHEYTGGSFTVSNLGMYDVSEFSAIINPPQAAILAVAAIKEKPVNKDGAVVIGKVMRLTVSSDHRVVDGTMAAEFLNTLQKLLENPAGLLVS